jgi:hypothetical protein
VTVPVGAVEAAVARWVKYSSSPYVPVKRTEIGREGGGVGRRYEMARQ